VFDVREERMELKREDFGALAGGSLVNESLLELPLLVPEQQ
jgi:hypothetical protein